MTRKGDTFKLFTIIYTLESVNVSNALSSSSPGDRSVKLSSVENITDCARLDMYLAKQQHDDNGDNNDDDDDDDDHFGVSRSAAVGAVGSDVVVEDEQQAGMTGGQPTGTRDRETQMRQQLQSVPRSARDDEEPDDDDDDDGDVIVYSSRAISPDHRIGIVLDRACFVFQFTTVASDAGATSRVIVIGWDGFRSRLMLFLIACLVIWACVFFPLLDT